MTTPLNPFGFFERSRRPVTPFHELSEREQRRQENSLLRILPMGSTRQQARKTLSSARRSGRVFRSGANPTPEEATETARYQQRSARSRLSAERRHYRVPPSGPPVTGVPGIFNVYQWNYTPDGHLIEPGGRIVQYYDPDAAVNTLNLADLKELSTRKAEFFRGYLDEMALTENPPGEYSKAKFDFRELKFESRRENWNAASHIRFNQMSYEEYRAYGKAIEARNQEIKRAGGKPVRGDWMYH